jgi:hypothetical protein
MNSEFFDGKKLTIGPLLGAYMKLYQIVSIA